MGLKKRGHWSSGGAGVGLPEEVVVDTVGRGREMENGIVASLHFYPFIIQPILTIYPMNIPKYQNLMAITPCSTSGIKL